VRRLRIASWPGFGASHNAFVSVFLSSLEAEGAEITGIERTADFPARWPAPAPDILLLHWAERVFGEARSRGEAIAGMARVLGALARRPAGTKAVWLVHNLAPHDARAFQRLVWKPYVRTLARRIDGFLTLSPGTVATVRDTLPALAGKPGLGLWHPSYPGAALAPEARARARAGFGWTGSERVLGYCGQIRPYKGVEDLVAAFRKTAAPDLRLLLAGRPGNAALAGWLEQAAREDGRIALRLADLDAAAFNAALCACDVVAAPLRRYLHSGSIVHALSAARPVLTPATPFAEALEGLVGADWMRTYDGPLTPELLAAQRPAPPTASGAPDLSACAPEAVGRAAMAFFRGLAG
jgi:glycosyltransferase involved in cell wall biosynthesis